MTCVEWVAGLFVCVLFGWYLFVMTDTAKLSAEYSMNPLIVRIAVAVAALERYEQNVHFAKHVLIAPTETFNTMLDANPQLIPTLEKLRELQQAIGYVQ